MGMPDVQQEIPHFAHQRCKTSKDVKTESLPVRMQRVRVSVKAKYHMHAMCK